MEEQSVEATDAEVEMTELEIEVFNASQARDLEFAMMVDAVSEAKPNTLSKFEQELLKGNVN